jgi:hypothetical protein
VSRRIAYGAAVLVCSLALISIVFPQLAGTLWRTTFWGIVGISVVVVGGVAINIVSVLASMYFGYRPQHEGGPSRVLPFPSSQTVDRRPMPANRIPGPSREKSAS